jgi:starch synthase
MRYDQIWGLQVTYQDLWVPWFNYHIHCTVYSGHVHGRKCFFIDPHSRDNFFSRGAYYGFPDEHMRFAFFSKAALEFIYRTGKRPDVIHTHDWQTALAPVMLYEIYQALGMGNCRVCHTLHNVRHQGIAGENVLWHGARPAGALLQPRTPGRRFQPHRDQLHQGRDRLFQLHYHRLAAP